MDSFVTRTQARSVPCSYCGAEPGNRCSGKRGAARESNHRERVEGFVRVRDSH